jgi:hypothetical protein
VCLLDSAGSRFRLVPGSCEHGNGPSGYIKSGIRNSLRDRVTMNSKSNCLQQGITSIATCLSPLQPQQTIIAPHSYGVCVSGSSVPVLLPTPLWNIQSQIRCMIIVNHSHIVTPSWIRLDRNLIGWLNFYICFWVPLLNSTPKFNFDIKLPTRLATPIGRQHTSVYILKETFQTPNIMVRIWLCCIVFGMHPVRILVTVFVGLLSFFR